MRNPNIPTLALTVTPQRTCTLATPIPSLSCEASPYGYISRAVFVSFMFPEEGLITENARNVLFFFSHSTTVCTRMDSSKRPSPRGPPNHGDRGDYEDRSRSRREWSGAPLLPPSVNLMLRCSYTVLSILQPKYIGGRQTSQVISFQCYSNTECTNKSTC